MQEFIIKIDQREKKPWFTGLNQTHSKKTSIRYARNETADYTIEGGENEIAIERKSLIDMLGTLSLAKDDAGNRKRDRFEREIGRMQGIRQSYIVVEAPLERILQCGQALKGQISKILLLRIIIRLKRKYPRTRWFFAANREQAEQISFTLLWKAYQKIKGDVKCCQKEPGKQFCKCSKRETRRLK